MKHKVTKAIFPVAGQGTRFLPATKSIPKEIMTLVDRPLVQYAIDEARAAGIKEFIFVTSRGKGALEDYFDEAPELERSLRKKGKAELLSVLKATNMESGAIAYIRQHQAMGLGHAVWCARRLIGDEHFAVLLPDDVISAQKPCLQQMVEAYEETGGSMVALQQRCILLRNARYRKRTRPTRICQGHGRKASLGARALKLCSHRPLYLTADHHAQADQDQTRCLGQSNTNYPRFLQIRTATYDRARRQFGRGFETVDPTGGAQLAKPATRIPTAKPGPLGNL